MNIERRQVSKERWLNSYAGLGGNRKLWKNVNVVAVEKNEKIAKVYQDNFPDDEVIIGDAHQYLLENSDNFDGFWGSPPCQSHSRMVKATRHKIRKYAEMNLYQEIIFLQHFFKGKWVVENVKPYYNPLIEPMAKLGRHYFWSNFEISDFNIPSPKGFITSGSSKESVQNMKDWLGIQYEGNIYYEGNHCPAQVLRNCVPPEMGLHVFNEANK